MLSIFPELLPYGLLAPTIVRIIIGVVLVIFGLVTLFTGRAKISKKLSESKYPFANFVPWPLGIILLVTGGFLIVGFLTQVVAIVGAYLFFNLMLIDRGSEKIFHQGNIFYIAMILISLSLLFSGAGAFAVDLPL